jgi:hypothetical protein
MPAAVRQQAGGERTTFFARIILQMRLCCFTVASRTSGKGLQAVLVVRGLLQQHSRSSGSACCVAGWLGARGACGVCIIGYPSGGVPLGWPVATLRLL